MNEFLKEIISIYKEKTKLPIISTYIIVLIIWNWDIISIYVFSNSNIETRICIIKNIVNKSQDHFFRILYPVLISFGYPVITLVLTLIIEFITNPFKNNIVKIQFNQKKDLARKSLEIEEERTGQKSLEELRVQLSAEKAKHNGITQQMDELTKEYLTAQDNYSKLLNESKLNTDKQFDLDNTIIKLNKEIDKLKNQNKESSKDYSEREIVYQDVEGDSFLDNNRSNEVTNKNNLVNLYNNSSSEEREFTFKYLSLLKDTNIRHNKNSKDKLNKYVYNLIKENLVEMKDDGTEDEFISISERGMKYLQMLKLIRDL